MDVGVTSAILASIVCLACGIAIMARRPQRPLYRSFAQLSLVLFIWHAASLTSRFGAQKISVWQCAAAVLIPPPAILFFRELLRDRGLLTRRLVRVAWALSAALFTLNFSRLGTTVWLRLPAATYVFVTLALVQRALFRHIRRTRSASDRKRLSALFVGGLITFASAVGELVPKVAPLAAMGHVTATLYVYTLYQSVVARRLIDLVELLGKAAVLATLTLLLATVYALLVLWVGPDQSGLWLFNTVVASFVILILYDQVRPLIEESTARLLFRERLALGGAIDNLVKQLRTTLGVESMQQRVMMGLQKSGRIQNAALFLAQNFETSWRLVGFIGSKPPDALMMADQPTLLSYLRQRKKPLLEEHLLHRLDELPTLPLASDPTLQHELARCAEAVATMRSLGANVVVPMLIDERIVGLLTVGGTPGTSAFSTDELAGLLRLAEACAVVIDNGQAYEQRRERDRLVVVGEMAAGVAHEIRNPLGAIKGAAQCLDPQSLPPEAKEFVDVIVEEVNRLSSVVGQFLEYARPLRPNIAATKLNDVVSATLRLLRRGPMPAAVMLEEALQLNLPAVDADPEHLRQIIINLVLNAVQAMPQGGHLRVATQQEGQSHVVLSVQDNGDGIAAGELAQIFAPFYTTKPQGTGLGLAISRRLVEAQGGSIYVQSYVGRGTTFCVRLRRASTLDEAPQQRLTA